MALELEPVKAPNKGEGRKAGHKRIHLKGRGHIKPQDRQNCARSAAGRAFQPSHVTKRAKYRTLFKKALHSVRSGESGGGGDAERCKAKPSDRPLCQQFDPKFLGACHLRES